MDSNKKFFIEKDGTRIEATILTNFELYGDNYCIYSIPNKQNNDVYCAKVLGNKLVKIDNEEELRLTNKIVTELLTKK